MDITKFIGKTEPEFVYHYTTPQGFLGITDSKSIWATNIHYLNDNKEFLHAIELFKTELRKRKKQEPDKSELYDFLSNSFSNIEHLKLFVCSFTEEGDLLSQWRGYCPNGGGVSLGFDFKAVKKSAQAQNYQFGPCIYDAQEKIAVISNILNEVLPEIEKIIGVTPENEVRGYFYSKAITVAPFMKHLSFKEEKEWRCSLFPSSHQIKAVKYRTLPSLIVPYHEIRLDVGSNFKLSRIIVGPSEHIELQNHSISDVLHVKGIEWGQLTHSAAPYRTLS